jgi:hypothetical protein
MNQAAGKPAMEVKGSAIVVAPAFVGQQFGPQGLERFLIALSDDSRKLMSSAILVNEWYPIGPGFLEPTETICRLFYADNLRGAWELGRFSADYALGGIYRAFVKLISVKYFIQRASVMMSTYYKPSRIEVASISDYNGVVQMTEFAAASPYVERRIAGWMQRALEIHGCREVRVEITRSLAGGDGYTEFTGNWQ